MTKCGDAAGKCDRQPRHALATHHLSGIFFFFFFLLFYSLSVADVPISCSVRCVFQILTFPRKEEQVRYPRVFVDKH